MPNHRHGPLRLQVVTPCATHLEDGRGRPAFPWSTHDARAHTGSSSMRLRNRIDGLERIPGKGRSQQPYRPYGDPSGRKWLYGLPAKRTATNADQACGMCNRSIQFVLLTKAWNAQERVKPTPARPVDIRVSAESWPAKPPRSDRPAGTRRPIGPSHSGAAPAWSTADGARPR
jgi:hypothetical protein